MFAHSLLDALCRLLLGSKLIKGMAALLLGGSTLYWVAEEVNPAEGTVLVHVIEPDVEVIVGDQVFWIKDREWCPDRMHVAARATPASHDQGRPDPVRGMVHRPPRRGRDPHRIRPR